MFSLILAFLDKEPNKLNTQAMIKTQHFQSWRSRQGWIHQIIQQSARRWERKGEITSVQDVLFATAAVKLPFNKSQLAAAFNVDVFGSCHLLFLSDSRRCLSS